MGPEQFVGHNGSQVGVRITLKKYKPKGTAEAIHANSACLQEIRQRNIMFPWSENTFCYISYHGALWASSNYNNPPQTTKTSICGVIQEPLLQALSIVFPYQMQNVPDQKVSWKMTVVFPLLVFSVHHFSPTNTISLWKYRAWVIAHIVSALMKNEWLIITFYMCELRWSCVTKGCNLDEMHCFVLLKE